MRLSFKSTGFPHACRVPCCDVPRGAAGDRAGVVIPDAPFSEVPRDVTTEEELHQIGAHMLNHTF